MAVKTFWECLGQRPGESIESLIKRRRSGDESSAVVSGVEKREEHHTLVRIQKTQEEPPVTQGKELPVMKEEAPPAPPSQAEAWMLFKARADELCAKGMLPHIAAAHAREELDGEFQLSKSYHTPIPAMSPMAAQGAAVKKRAQELVSSGQSKNIVTATCQAVQELGL